VAKFKGNVIIMFAAYVDAVLPMTSEHDPPGPLSEQCVPVRGE